jgi:glycosyltransferase involved in cell wall biosynthesis
MSGAVEVGLLLSRAGENPPFRLGNRLMRLAIISTPFVAVPPHLYGGTELVVHELAEGLVKRGHDIVLFATGDSRTSAELRSLYPQPQWPPEMLSDLNHVSWAMQQIAEDARFDMVHAHSAVALACSRLLPTVPLVYTIHHERDEQLSAFYRHCRDVNYVTISNDQRRREIPLDHVDVIHHGLEPSKYEWSPRAAGDYVAFVGRFSRVKGPHLAIETASRAGVQLRIAGEIHPPDEAWASAELRHRLTEPHVRYLGSIGLDEKRPLLRDARALLMPIEWNEPFGLIIIEAMLSGCPVVAFARGSVPELVENGVTGFIARNVDEMAALIRPGGPIDDVNRRRCRERAIQRFSRDRMVADHIAMYDRIRRSSPTSFPRPRRTSLIPA